MNKLKIAIIEDDPAIASMYRIKFETEGFEVQVAENGELGLKMIEDFKPSLVLLDLMMPLMNGDEVLQNVRNSSWGKDLKVIILTNMGQQEAPAVLETLNVDSYIVKADMTPKQVAEFVKERLGI